MGENPAPVKGEVTFDLVMEDEMSFVEGCCRLEDDIWCVFMFRKSRNGIEEVGVRKNLVWDSGVTGLNIIVSDDTTLNKSTVLRALAGALDVTEWAEVRGPDSMNLR